MHALLFRKSHQDSSIRSRKQARTVERLDSLRSALNQARIVPGTGSVSRTTPPDPQSPSTDGSAGDMLACGGKQVRLENSKRSFRNRGEKIMGAYICDAGGIGRLWLSQYHISSAAFFRQLEHRLIVLNHYISYSILPMELKLSHVKRMGIVRPPAHLYLVSAPCSDRDRGPSC